MDIKHKMSKVLEYQKRNIELGLSEPEAFGQSPLKLHIKYALIRETQEKGIIDKNYNLTNKGLRCLEDYLSVAEKDLEKKIRFAAIKTDLFSYEEEKPNFSYILESGHEKDLIRGMVPYLRLIFDNDLIARYRQNGSTCLPEKPFEQSERNLVKIANENGFKAGLLYIGLAAYAVKKAQEKLLNTRN